MDKIERIHRLGLARGVDCFVVKLYAARRLFLAGNVDFLPFRTRAHHRDVPFQPRCRHCHDPDGRTNRFGVVEIGKIQPFIDHLFRNGGVYHHCRTRSFRVGNASFRCVRPHDAHPHDCRGRRAVLGAFHLKNRFPRVLIVDVDVLLYVVIRPGFSRNHSRE